MMTTINDHTAIRQRTIPSRLWRSLASLNDSAGLTEIDWRKLAGVLLWQVRLVLFVATAVNVYDQKMSYAFVALLAVVAINTLPGGRR